MTTDPKDINAIFKTFYQMLYSKQNGEVNDTCEYLDGRQLLTITSQQMDELKVLITIKDTQDTITHLKNKKAPGPDGFRAEYLKTMKTVITPSLLPNR